MTTPNRHATDDTAPAALSDVALITGRAAAAAASISISHFHELVRQGLAPQPAIRAPRCTRWRVVDVRRWLVDFAQPSPAVEQEVLHKASRASKAAQAKRAATGTGA